MSQKKMGAGPTKKNDKKKMGTGTQKLKMGPHFAKNTLFSLQPSILILRTSHFRYEISKTFFRPHPFLFFPTNISFVQTTGTHLSKKKWVPKMGTPKMSSGA